jgi:hypothetical protein
MNSKYKSPIQPNEEMRRVAEYYDEGEGEDNTFFDLYEKNQKRIERYLRMQRGNVNNDATAAADVAATQKNNNNE